MFALLLFFQPQLYLLKIAVVLNFRSIDLPLLLVLLVFVPRHYQRYRCFVTAKTSYCHEETILQNMLWTQSEPYLLKYIHTQMHRFFFHTRQRDFICIRILRFFFLPFCVPCILSPLRHTFASFPRKRSNALSLYFFQGKQIEQSQV